MPDLSPAYLQALVVTAHKTRVYALRLASHQDKTRDDYEQQYTDQLHAYFVGFRKTTVANFQQPDPMAKQKQHDDLKKVLLALLALLALMGIRDALRELNKQQLFPDDDAIQARAHEWAGQYVNPLADLVYANILRVVNQIEANWRATPGATLADLDAALSAAFDGNLYRAMRIVVTEQTRAYARGLDIAYTAAGAARAAFLPPLHPFCRCNPEIERLPNGQLIQYWRTAEDEKVCHQDTETRIGVVEGCAGLHEVVISEGPWLGKTLREARREYR